MGEFRMPALGADMEVGTVTEWLVTPGDRVERGDIVAVVDTEKSVIEVEVFESGVVEELLVPEGERVAVGTPLAVIGAGEPAAEPEEAAGPVPEPEEAAGAPDEPEEEAVRPVAEPPPPEEPFVSPLVRQRARELGVDLGALSAAGEGGRITRDDVERAAEARPAVRETAAAPTPPVAAEEGRRLRVSPRARRAAARHGVDVSHMVGTGPGAAITAEDVERATAERTTRPPAEAAPAGPAGGAPGAVQEVEAPAAPEDEAPAASADAPAEPARRDAGQDMRTAIARLMARSKREIPHFYLGHDVDVTDALAWLERENLRRPVAERLLPAAWLLRATALAASDVPEVNGHWREERFVAAATVDLGVTVSLRSGGLSVPVIADAAAKSLDEVMAALNEIVPRARKGRLRSTDVRPGSLTVTNLGDQGVDTIYGVIHPPQVALVGFGQIRERPWAACGMVGARRVLTVTLSADHRAIDGRIGASFLSALERRLTETEEP